ncbi:helix-turn-helix domain-containing protein [Bradyrhizobium japonicum]|uniref:helix-turn-helix domain-containing protein n=1 Tax=Bradyrhizobium japonicum TaxID=375 RepID=UPI000577892B|nr:helix-turn-helix domain-containing protein [Bradyrhizobium japonicum]
MFVRTADSRPRPNLLSEIGLSTASDPIISSSEFTYPKGTEIFGEKEPAMYVYQIKRGAVRSYKLLPDGRRQIGAFHLVGDIFGLENGDKHRFTADAIVDTVVRLIKRTSLQLVAAKDAVVSHHLLSMTTRNLEHAENHMLLLGRKTAAERVAAFLLEMDCRAGAEKMLLPMSRRDIADYLGLTIETVSRVLSRLRRAGVVTVEGEYQRELILLDRRRLADFDPQT